MTLIPITEKTTICIVDCGKRFCSCKPVTQMDKNIVPISEEILQQLLINKYSGNTTVFVNDKEYRVIKRLEYGFEVEEL